MNATLAAAAVAAIDDPNYEQEPGFCQRFVRQVAGAVYGDQYDELWLDSAKHSAEAAQAAGYAVDGPPELGDLLYKTEGSGGFGHVGILVEGERVAENSSTRIGRVQGAKGFRSLAQFGSVDVTVRLPDPAAGWAVALPDGQQLTCAEHDEQVWVGARAWADALGLPIEGANRRVRLGGSVVPLDAWDRAGSYWLPIRVLARAAGLAVEVTGRTVRVRRPA